MLPQVPTWNGKFHSVDDLAPPYSVIEAMPLKNHPCYANLNKTSLFYKQSRDKHHHQNSPL